MGSCQGLKQFKQPIFKHIVCGRNTTLAYASLMNARSTTERIEFVLFSDRFITNRKIFYAHVLGPSKLPAVPQWITIFRIKDGSI